MQALLKKTCPEMKKLALVTIAYLSLCIIGFSLMHFFGVQGDYVAAISTSIVGFLAYAVYELGKVNQSADAAKILVLDIRNAEEGLLSLRAEMTPSAWTKVVMLENNWAKYKQLFVSVLNTDEFRSVDHFFHNWSHLVKWKNEMESFGLSQALTKAGHAQERLLLASSTDVDLEQQRMQIIGRANSEQWLFEPDLLGSRVFFFLNALQPISGTTAFAKLRKNAGLPE
jgi:hypothetical protein